MVGMGREVAKEEKKEVGEERGGGTCAGVQPVLEVEDVGVLCQVSKSADRAGVPCGAE